MSGEKGAGQLSDMNIQANNDIANKFAEFAREYFERLLRFGGNTTKTIGIRVPASVHAMYIVLPPEVKWAIRKTVIEMIEQSFDQVSRNVPIININVNNNINLNMAKAENKVEVKVDVSSILTELEELGKLVYNWYRLNRIPKAAYDTASSKIKKVAQLIKQMN